MRVSGVDMGKIIIKGVSCVWAFGRLGARVPGRVWVLWCWGGGFALWCGGVKRGDVGLPVFWSGCNGLEGEVVRAVVDQLVFHVLVGGVGGVWLVCYGLLDFARRQLVEREVSELLGCYLVGDAWGAV